MLSKEYILKIPATLYAFLGAFYLMVGSIMVAQPVVAGEFSCNGDAAWKRVRDVYPLHAQVLAKCDAPEANRSILVLTEPPPHFSKSYAEPILRALFQSTILSVERKVHPLGFDGWANDLVVQISREKSGSNRALANDLTNLAAFIFGSAYKTEVEDIKRLTAAPLWQAPPSVEVRVDELARWLLGSNAMALVPPEGGAPATLKQRAARGEIGTYITTAPGLVVALLPRDESLNNHAGTLRRFAVDSDAFIGAVPLEKNRLALVGRERTATLAAMPPLRVETILLLAASKSSQLAQSYERSRPFAGKLLSEAGDLFGWDWGPILLSNELNDTEYGSLLNFTDNMLKSWSGGGNTEYKGFPHPAPKHFPFGKEGVMRKLEATRLTFNWNTAGAGYISRAEGREIFMARRTGSLPVSYFPEGTVMNEAQKARLMTAEDEAYQYFNDLRSPMLARAVQYAALYQTFRAFPVQATPPHKAAPDTASFKIVEGVLKKNMAAALRAIPDASKPTNEEPLLFDYFVTFGAGQKDLYPKADDEIKKALRKMRVDLKEKYQNISQKYGQSWINDLSESLAEGGDIPENAPLRSDLLSLRKEGINLVLAPETVRQAVVKAMQREPDGWIRTPSIVVSRDTREKAVGGHNIGGRATRLVVDPTVSKGQVRVTGTYEEGRVLHVNPADAPHERDLVREFDRTVGLEDSNIPSGKAAIEARLTRPLPPPGSPRDVYKAMRFEEGAAPAVQTARGARASQYAEAIGPRPVTIDTAFIEAAAVERKADVVIARLDQGYVVYGAFPKPPSRVLAPNEASLFEAVDLATRKAALDMPPPPNPRIAFMGMSNQEINVQLSSLELRAKAMAGGGGKPPFGGDRGPFVASGGPDPMRPFSARKGDGSGSSGGNGNGPSSSKRTFWEDLLVKVGVKPEKFVPLEIHGDMAYAKTILQTQPDWGRANIRFPDTEGIYQIGGSNPGAIHVVEIDVPVNVNGKAHNPFMQFISWFHESRSPAQSAAIQADIRQTMLKDGGTVEDILKRYKHLMTEKFGAEKVQMEIREEAGRISVTERIHDAHTEG